MSSRKPSRQRRPEANAAAESPRGDENEVAAASTAAGDPGSGDAPVSTPNPTLAAPERYTGDQQLGSKLTYMAIVLTLLIVMKLALGW